MAQPPQTEDTELRDLVIEALDKNGSLAKIRALLRANVFLAFEDECANIKHNPALDTVLQSPEGLLALSIVHEFLEFCNLKNTLFVYTAESRQGKDYQYDGRRLRERLSLPPRAETKEPALTLLLKQLSISLGKKLGPIHLDNLKGSGDKCYKDDQNCTYIVHEDFSGSTTSNSHSDSSSDDKNKLHLRLNLDTSDTDTSSDSAREKSCSEYIPNEHFLTTENKPVSPPKISNQNRHNYQKPCIHSTDQTIHSPYLHELKLINNSSSDSTSYADLKSFNKLDEKLINTAGVPFSMTIEPTTCNRDENFTNQPITKPPDKIILKTVDAKEDKAVTDSKSQCNDDTGLNQNYTSTSVIEETAEYSYDFTSPHTPPSTKTSMETQPSESIQEVFVQSLNKSTENQNLSPHSSISISDVADLISEKSYVEPKNKRNQDSTLDKNNPNESQQKMSDDSGDFSQSPVPSISNLSLDIQSD